MHDLSAVAGVTGDTLKEIEGYARESAKAFGDDATNYAQALRLEKWRMKKQAEMLVNML